MNCVTERAGEEFGTTMALGYWTRETFRPSTCTSTRSSATTPVADFAPVTREKNGVTVGGGAGGGLGCDVAAGSAPVLDHHLLAPCFREPGRDDAGDRVGSPARRERHDQAHEPVRPIRHRQSLLGRRDRKSVV